MPEITIEHEETEAEWSRRISRGDLRELVGKVVNDLVRYGVDQATADHTAAALVRSFEALNDEGMAGLSMVLQALRHAHRPVRHALGVFLAQLSLDEAMTHATHAQSEAFLALCAVGRHPELPQTLRGAVQQATDAARAHMELGRSLYDAVRGPDVDGMEVAGNA